VKWQTGCGEWVGEGKMAVIPTTAVVFRSLRCNFRYTYKIAVFSTEGWRTKTSEISLQRTIFFTFIQKLHAIPAVEFELAFLHLGMLPAPYDQHFNVNTQIQYTASYTFL